MATILVVDDEPASSEFLATLLERGGHQILEAADGREGLEKARTSRPDLAIVDILLPNMDGCEFVQHLRVDPTVSRLPVIFYTGAFREEEAWQLARRCGVSHILTKPSDVQTILKTVNEVLAAGPSLPEAAVPSKQAQDEHVRLITRKLFEKVAELEASRRRLQLILRSLPLAVYAAQGDGDHFSTLWIEGNLERLSGFPATQFTDSSFWASRLHSEDRSRVLRELANVFRTGFLAMQYRWQCADGSYRWFYSEAAVVKKEDGRANEIAGIWLDVTERVKAEEAESEGRARTAAIVEAALDAIITIDHDGKIVEFNSAAERVFGHSRAEVIGREMAELIVPPSLRDKHRQGLARYLATGEGPVLGKRLELPALRADGHEFPVELTITRLPEPGQPMFTGFVRDITERKQAEQQLREQATLLDYATDAIFVRDLDDRITFWNRSAEKLFGWTAGEAVGRNAFELLFRERPPELEEARKTFSEKGEWQGELRKTTKGGKELTLLGRWTTIRDGAGRAKGVLVIDTDITERKKLENRFLRAQRLESIGALAGGIAHDLNNMLTPIMMAIDFLRSNPPESVRQSILQTLQTSADRGAALVKQILSFARGAEGERRPLQLQPLIKELGKLLQQTFPRSIEVRTVMPADLWLIAGDATQVHQVLMNLCVNARDAMPDGGKLTIGAENRIADEHYAAMHPEAKPGPHVLLRVTDTGTGIPPEILNKIFDPFFTTKEQGKGTGLGLATVIGIVRSHGGFVNVYSEVDKGTEFMVHLPALETADVRQSQQAQAPLPAGRGETILVVDDEAAILEIARVTLEAYGYRVLTAGDGAEAMGAFAQHRGEIQAVLTDMMMPVMDGAATIRALRKLDPTVPIIAASGLTEQGRLPEVAAENVQAFLHKPYSADKLLYALQAALAKRRG